MTGPELWSDADAGTALRDVLAERGWNPDVGDPWVAFHLPLDGALLGAADEAERAATAVADRVAVQRSGFRGSTFTEEKWHRMAAGPGYRPELDLLVRTADGVPAAAATAWLGADGGTAILEPVAAHPDHRRGGHARTVVLACARAAHDLGATDLCVCTPASNDTAVSAYARMGFTVFERFTAMTLGSAA
jgi:GNAT superfamily N-acetyltransferase